MAERDMTLAYQFQQLEARWEAARAAQLELDLERDHHQLALDYAQDRQQTFLQGYGRSQGYDGPDDVRMPREIGPVAGSREAVDIELLAEANAAREQAREHEQGMGY